MDISNAWGYGAVIIPAKGAWQAFTIIDPERADLKGYVEGAMATARAATEKVVNFDKSALAPEGALAATIIDRFEAGDERGLAIFSSALSKMTDTRFWVIDANLDDFGVTTRHVPLSATTPEEAQKAIKLLVATVQFKQLMNDGPK